MLKKLLEYFTHLLNLAEATRENKAEIKEIRRELRDLTLAVQLVASNQRHEMEKAALRLENEVLRLEKRLPPPKTGK